MNVNPNMEINAFASASALDEAMRNFYIDAEGNRVEIPFDLDTASDGEAAPAETTVYIAADEADHPVTVTVH